MEIVDMNLPVSPDLSDRNRAIQLLQIGEAAGWFMYEAIAPKEGRGGVDRFAVRLPSGARRVLLGPEVRGWVLGVADVHGGAARVAYRRGLLDGGDTTG